MPDHRQAVTAPRLPPCICLSGRLAWCPLSTRPPAVQYDTDVVTWSPQGRIHQIEYAMEAVKQGSAAVGLKVTLT